MQPRQRPGAPAVVVQGGAGGAALADVARDVGFQPGGQGLSQGVADLEWGSAQVMDTFHVVVHVLLPSILLVNYLDLCWFCDRLKA